MRRLVAAFASGHSWPEQAAHVHGWQLLVPPMSKTRRLSKLRREGGDESPQSKAPVARVMAASQFRALVVVAWLSAAGAAAEKLPDPKTEGWTSETFAENASKALGEVGEALKSGNLAAYARVPSDVLRPAVAANDLRRTGFFGTTAWGRASGAGAR